MHRYKSICLALILIPAVGFAQQKTKKHSDVPAVFENAHFIYVESGEGDALKPGVFPEDRQAIYDVEDGLREWGRYALATRRTEADVVLVVRKGRVAEGQVHAGIGVGSRPPGNPSSSRAPVQTGQPNEQEGDSGRVGAEADMGPAIDVLRVYLASSDGKLTGPVWTREMQDGLDAPSVRLLQQLRAAVERAYPSQPAPVKRGTP